MKKNSMMAAALGAVAAVALAVVTHAAPVGPKQAGFGGGLMGGCPGGRGFLQWLGVPELMEEAGLTPEQIEALRELQVASHREAIRLRGEAQIASFDARTLMQAESPDEAAVMAAIEAAGEARTRLHQHLASSLLDARRLVGEEAWTDLKTRIREDLKGWRRERRGHGFGRRGPGRGVCVSAMVGSPRFDESDDELAGAAPLF